MSEMTLEPQIALADDLLAKFEHMVATGSTYRTGSEVYIGDDTKREYSIESVCAPGGMWGNGDIRYHLAAVTHRHGTAYIEFNSILTDATEADMRGYIRWMRPRVAQPTPENYGGW